MSEKLDQVAAHALNEADSLMDFPEGDEWQKPKLSDSVVEMPLDLGDPEYCADLKPCKNEKWVASWCCRVELQTEAEARAIMGLMNGNHAIVSASVTRADQDYETE